MRVRVHTATNGISQIHTYGGGLENQVNHWENLGFETITEFSHGHHARAGGGSDTFNFVDIDNVRDTIVGRLEDFDPSRDEIRIEGLLLDLNNLPANVRVVAFNGAHNDPGTAPQPWLLIETPAGGHIFYALEGARIDMNGNGGSNGHQHEQHFLTLPHMPDFDTLPDIDFVDPVNVVPEGVTADGGLVINDVDTDEDEVLAVITGSAAGDAIGAGLNDDTVHGQQGNDVIWGGSGSDAVFGGEGADSLHGGSGDDLLVGGNQADNGRSDAGADLLTGGAGSDEIRGGGGHDTLEGGDGHDRLVGDWGADYLAGDAGNDTLISNSGVDTVLGGAGDDWISSGNGADIIDGGRGDDYAIGRSGTDIIDGGAGNDSLFGSAGADTISGGSGNDYVSAGSAWDVVFGDSGHDTLEGNFGSDALSGEGGNDSLLGGTGDDTLSGGAGNDTLLGNQGRDILDGGAGDDLLRGGTLADEFHFDLGGGTDTIQDFENFQDELHIATGLVDGMTDGRDIVDTYASVVEGDTVFDFTDGTTLILEGQTDVAALYDNVFAV